ncbi:MAG: hypothetical protein IIX44_06010 [Clostridia bacterium]|nr:hypothetical protein [Clostridia bacterium]
MMFFKTKRISIILLFIVSTMLIGIFAGCAGIGDTEKDKYVLSKAEFDEINDAYRKYLEQSSGLVLEEGLTDSRKLMDSYFRGRYGDCIVLKKSSITTDFAQYEVAGYPFAHGGQLLVIHDSTVYSLTGAYESGLLTDSDIKDLSEVISGKKND